MDPRKQSSIKSLGKLSDGLNALERNHSFYSALDDVAADDGPTIPNARLDYVEIQRPTDRKPGPLAPVAISPEAVTEVFRTLPNLQPLFVDSLWGKAAGDPAPPAPADEQDGEDLTYRQQPAVVVGDPADPRVGQVFGKFRLVRRIGGGGMGEVYAAQHCEIDTQAAVKILSPQMACQPEFRERFVNEAKAVNQIQDPGLVKIFDQGQRPDGTLYIIMELLEGESLYQRLKRDNGPLPAIEAVEIAWRVAHALAAAHKKHIVHRDLTPANIMLQTLSGELAVDERRAFSWATVKVVDFGIAKLTRNEAPSTASGAVTANGMLLGSPQYMAPEQFVGAGRVTGQADVFSLGLILHEMLTGQRLGSFGAWPAGATDSRAALVVRSNTYGQLAKLLDGMLLHEPAQRPTMSEVALQLGRLRLLLSVRPQRWWLRLAAGLAVLLGAAIFIAIRCSRPVTLSEIQANAVARAASALSSPDPTKKLLAVRVLGVSGDFSHYPQLAAVFRKFTAEIDAATAKAASQIGAFEIAPKLVSLLKGGGLPLRVRLSFADALRRLRDPMGRKFLLEMLEKPGIEQQFAARALVEYGDRTGAPILHQMIDQQLVDDADRWQILGLLALAGDTEAREQLVKNLHQQSNSSVPGSSIQQESDVVMYAAYYLALLGDGQARWILARAVTRGRRPSALTATLAAGIGEARACVWLAETALDQAESESSRVTALRGLALCPPSVALTPLNNLIDDESPLISLEASASALHIVAADPKEVQRNGRAWAARAIESTNSDILQDAITILDSINTTDTVSDLGRMLSAPESSIRLEVVHALEGKSFPEALGTLQKTFDDCSAEVREAGMRAVDILHKSLESQGIHAPEQQEKLLRAGLQKLATTGDPQTRVVASGILLRLGDYQHVGQLRMAMKSPNPLIRMLAVEFADDESGVIEHLLYDDEFRVRWAAARRMAEHGSLAGERVLEDMVKLGGIDGLYAYRLLRRFQRTVRPPPRLMTLLESAKFPIRRQVIQAVTELPPQEGLALLIVASRDDATIVRSQVVKTAKQAYLAQKLPAYLNVLRSMSSDPSPLIRSQVAEALAKLPMPQSDEQADPAAMPDSAINAQPPAPPPPQNGTLSLHADELIAFSLDGGDYQPVPKAPIHIKAGKHRICWATDCKVIQVGPGQELALTIPVRLPQQLLARTKIALEANKLSAVKERIEQLSEMQRKRTLSSELLPWLVYYRGRFEAAKGNFDEALNLYNESLDYAEAPSTAVVHRLAREAALHVSTASVLDLSVEDESHRCHRTIRYYPEGKVKYHVLGSSDRYAEVHPGSPAVINHCSKATPQ